MARADLFSGWMGSCYVNCDSCIWLLHEPAGALQRHLSEAFQRLVFKFLLLLNDRPAWMPNGIFSSAVSPPPLCIWSLLSWLVQHLLLGAEKPQKGDLSIGGPGPTPSIVPHLCIIFWQAGEVAVALDSWAGSHESILFALLLFVLSPK